jgi:two-component system, NarL family, sensor histidine kinase BarA
MRRRSIRLKLVALVLASVGVSVTLVAGVSAWRDSRRDASVRAEQLHAAATVVASMAAEGVNENNAAKAFTAIRSIARMPGVVYARVENARGESLAETGAGARLVNDLTVERPGAQLTMWQLMGSRSLEATAPVVYAGRPMGQVVLLGETAGVWKQFAGSLLASVAAAAMAALVGLLVALRLQRAITAPLGALTTSMDEVQQTHDYDRVAEATTNDEIGDLVAGFNGMLAQIRARDKRIADHLAGLERTVDERTRDLATAKEAAEDANRSKSDFLATMSHEIRTPMNGIMVMAEMLAAGDMPARQRRFAEVIAKSGSSLLSIINDILDFSKIEAGKLELERTPVDVAEVVDDVMSLFWERARSKGLDLAAYIDPATPLRIAADEVRLRQIISNLVNNAIKFTETGGVLIQVETDVEGRIRIGVHDTGIGIARDKLASVFGAFTQADQSTTRKFGGTGLGLAISKRLVEAMEGQIGVDSEFGKGSVFAFRFPAEVLEPAADWPQFDAGVVALAVEGGCSAHALNRYAQRAGLQCADAETDTALVLIGEPAGLKDEPNGGPPRVCLAEYGDSTPGELLRQGKADALLIQPFRRKDLEAVLRQIQAGRPLKDLQAEQDAAARTEQSLPNFTGARVLVADDSAVNREVAIEALSRMGIAAASVNDGRAAIEAVMAEPFDMVLMDGSMPDIDGYDATREIRRLQSEAGEVATPIVALTAHVVGSAADAWREAGMDGVLHKPFTLASMAEVLGRFLTPLAEPLVAPQSAPTAAAPMPEAAPLPADDGLFDLDVVGGLKQMAAQGKADFVERVHRLYRDNAPGAVTALREASGPEDAARAAHALKSMSLNLGARRVAEAAAAMEAWCREGHDPRPDEVEALADALTATLARLGDDQAAAAQPSPAQMAASPAAVAAVDAETRALLDDLRWAVESDGLTLVYQPQYNRDGVSLMGVEALVRWVHPQVGPVHPAEFIPLAEQHGLIRPITDWVMDRALLETEAFPELTVSVNASALEFGDADFVDRIAALLERRRFNPRRLEIEITETAVLDREEQVRANMDRFRAMGVRVALDDFGAGYSSLRLLRLLPFDKLKIDREFITPCTDDTAAATVVHAVISIGRAMGMKVIAEGVETDAQRNFLKVAGVHGMQGFLFGRPAPVTEIAAGRAAAVG